MTKALGPSFTAAIFGLAILALIAVSVDATDAAPRGQADQSVRIDRQRALMSVNIQDQPWTDLAAELARQGGMVVHLQRQIDGTATASFENVPTERALRRLFGPDAQYVFRYDASSAGAVPVEVWVWKPRPVRPPSPPSSKNVTRTAVIHAVVDQQMWTAAPVLVEALHDVNPEVRKDAAVGLTLLRDAPVVEALEGLLHREQQPELRADVAEILATIASPPALAAVRPALVDPEPLVRLRVVMALVNSGGEPGLALVQEAARGGSAEARRAVRAMEHTEERSSQERNEER